MRRLLPFLLFLLCVLLEISGCSSGSSGGGNQPAPEADALTMQVTPQDAQIKVRAADGSLLALPRNGERLELDPGTYLVEVHRVRFVSAQRQVQVDGATRLDVRLQPEAPLQPLPGGPLRVSAANPRYFADNRGTLYLAGLHTWNNLIDMGVTQPPPALDFPAFLGFLGTHGVNATRLWAWEVPHPNDTETPLRDWASPQAWVRTGPGGAVDGLPKFDLTVHDEAHFVRMRERLRALQEHGIYAIVMLFEGWSVQNSPGAASHPFGASNNVNGIDHGGLRHIHTLDVPAIVDVQEAYVRKVVDTVHDLDNVLYEIANEAVSPESTDWQYHMIDYLEGYEGAKPKQHPVGMTWPLNGSDSVLFNSPADWISPHDGLFPAPATGDKVVLLDNDHIRGSRSGDQLWIWRSFTRALNTLFMDCYQPPDSLCDTPYAPAAGIRRALAATRSYAERMDLASARPRPELSSSDYCLASDTELAVFVPNGGAVSVELPPSAQLFSAEWYDPSTDEVHAAPAVAGGAQRDFTPPFAGPAVLFLWLPAP